ncbi:hypothetical protein SBADM41S_07448 [Streptomyces badius]
MRWVFTVASLMKSSAAISRLVVPRATRTSTSRSRADREVSAGSGAGVRTRVISREATAGDRTLRPSAAARTAANSSSRGASLRR